MEMLMLIEETAAGKKTAMDQLYRLIYEDLKRLAHKIRFNWRKSETLNTTALVHEAYLKVLSNNKLKPESKLHFYKLCGRAMRYVLHNNLEKKEAEKRGGSAEKIPIYEACTIFNSSETSQNDMVNLLSSLERLEKEDKILTQIVECRFFSDLTIAETATVLRISPATVKRKWSFARAYLSNQLKKSA